MRLVTNQPEDPVLRYLRQIAEKLEGHSAELAEVKERLTSLDGKLALLHGDFVGQSARFDRVDERLGRIERRLDLVPVQAKA